MKYKVLSVRQPYANLICKGIKDVENRSRRTNYRGLLLIHASASMHAVVPFLRKSPRYTYTANSVPSLILAEAGLIETQPDLNFGAIVGCCTLTDCIQNHPSAWAEKGMWHWVCENQIWFKKPIVNVKGQLGIWEWEGDIEELIDRSK